jgi:glutamyl-tRNA synthetase
VAAAIRFKVPSGVTAFEDLVHGRIEFDNTNIEDFVVLRSDAQPTYHLSVVVDDIEMEITHIVRGDDHISNTPKQILLYQALGRAVPAFAHVPLILGPDKKRLSKRHGATSVMEYQRLGYLPEAMVNFLALLGWSPGSDEELFSADELIARFTLEGISGGNAVFNPEKLDWFNQQHLLRLPPEDIVRRLEPVLRQQGLWRDEFDGAAREWLISVINLYKGRLKKLDQFAVEAAPLLTDGVILDENAVRKHLSKPELQEPFAELADAFEHIDPFTAARLEERLRSIAESRGLKAASLIHATRVAVTGRAASPGLFEVLELTGRQRVVQRIRAAEPFLLPTHQSGSING